MIGDRQRRGARRLRSSAFVAARAPSLRVFFVLVGLLALMIQSLVVQTHIHVFGPAALRGFAPISQQGNIPAGPTSVSGDSKSVPLGDRYPASQDPSNCPLCQEFAHFGQFTHAIAVLIALLFWGAACLHIFEATPSFATVSHTWRGRAPPAQSTQF